VTQQSTVRRCDREADTNVMGIVSSNPAFIGNVITGADGIMPPGYALVGLIGQVSVRATAEGGPIRAGDELTPASTPGFARRAQPGEPTVGVALEYLESGEGQLNVLIARRNSSVTVDVIEEKIINTIAAMEIEDEVQMLVQHTVDILDLDEGVADEVTRQLRSEDTLQSLEDRILSRLAASGSLYAEAQPDQDRGSIEGDLDIAQHLTVSGSITAGETIAADSASLESTLSVAGDTRIGGDLYLEGVLQTTDLFVPGTLSIDGDTTIAGELTAGRILAGSGSRIEGTLTLAGELQVASGGALRIASGVTLTVQDIIVLGGMRILGPITIEGLATFAKDVAIRGELTVSNRHAGFAVIPATGTAVTVLFSSGYIAAPVVTVSPDVPVLFAVSRATHSGFTIRLASPATETITFSWLALGTEQPNISMGIQASLVTDIDFPVDDNGVPLSSSDVWNSCIRGIPTLDAEGLPFSCNRYHDDHSWTHPDLGIEFTWDTSYAPARLELPEGYSATLLVTEAAGATENQNVIEGTGHSSTLDVQANNEDVAVDALSQAGTGAEVQTAEDPAMHTADSAEENEALTSSGSEQSSLSVEQSTGASVGQQ
jgi:cytoskeletal protein CcmA (bactofilin family)